MAKVLIIKLGYSETLNREINNMASLGDVLRTTVVLNFFKNDDVTWLLDGRAYPLLDNNPYVKQILIFNLESVLQLQRERFDTVINLEKGPGICALADSINAWRRFGFRFDENSGIAQSYDGAEKVLSLCFDLKKKKGSHRFWQDALASMIGRKWKGEEYILGYRPKSPIKYDIGFNWAIGEKWSNKAWPKKHWEKLQYFFRGKYAVSWQQGLESLYEYMEWLNSCRLIVTNDSLGMHLAIAMKKKIVALFGPSSSKEVYLYGHGVKILPEGYPYKCTPCLQQVCSRKINCMEFITPKRVKKEIEKLL